MSNLIKIHATDRNILDMSVFNEANGAILVPAVNDADFIISHSTIRYPDLLNKTVYLAFEPPKSNHRQWCYSNFDKMLLVVTYNPDNKKPNQIPFQSEDVSQLYPTRLDPFPFVTRKDTTINKRGVFYAGSIEPNEPLKNKKLANGAISITHLRKIVGDHLLKNNPYSEIIGIGWNKQEEKISEWRKEKWERIKNPNIDFVLALENTIMPNYISEKIWDGIGSDKVTLYLGDPRIEHHIPTNCFVDLRTYYDIEKDTFNLAELNKKINEMTQYEYDLIIDNARKFREYSKRKHKKYSTSLSKKILDILKESKDKKKIQLEFTEQYLNGIRDCKKIYSALSSIVIDISPTDNSLVVKFLKTESGFYSIMGQVLQQIIRLQNSSHPLDQLSIKIDGSSMWGFYKNDPLIDVYNELFISDLSVNVPFPYTGQGMNANTLLFRNANLAPLNLMLKRYFSMSEMQIKYYNEIVNKYQIDFDNTIGVCYRGTDKRKEVVVADPSEYVECVKKIIKNNPTMRVMIQTDQTQARDLFLNSFGNKCFFIEEMTTTESDKAIHFVVPENKKLDLAKTLEVSVRILSKCKYVVNCCSNVAWAISGYRGNAIGMWQFDYKGELVEPYKI